MNLPLAPHPRQLSWEISYNRDLGIMSGIIVQFDHHSPVTGCFLGYHLAHEFSFDGGSVHEGFFHNRAHFLRDLRDNGTDSPRPVLGKLALSRRETKFLSSRPRSCKARVISFSIFWYTGQPHPYSHFVKRDIGRGYMDKDQHRPGGKPPCEGMLYSFQFTFVMHSVIAQGPLLVHERNSVWQRRRRWHCPLPAAFPRNPIAARP